MEFAVLVKSQMTTLTVATAAAVVDTRYLPDLYFALVAATDLIQREMLVRQTVATNEKQSSLPKYNNSTVDFCWRKSKNVQTNRTINL